ncbi:MAG TPA: type III-A CRISPR-associated protein Csm2 [Candidatus Wunengus californicus]|uniref:type III-A CRISPR-associated protein Csm2 n=1 Tax=Candidatus Wunengus californicus TaxID=3367619 RepID=UPI00402955B2
MKVKSIEEKLSEEWGLKNAETILEKIIEKETLSKKEGIGLKELLDDEKMVVCSFALGKILASYEIGLKTAQLRRFYEAMLAIRGKKSASLMILKPQLAYAKARASRELTPFFVVVNPLMERVHDSEDFNRLVQFIEAIVAYHKYHGGKD